MEVIKQSKTSSSYNKTYSMKSLRDKNLRVVAYVRVSTTHDQKSSFFSQDQYYSSKISKNPNWELVNIYRDEGISGRSSKQRSGFMKMMEDAVNGKFDLILTKSVSRFARNTLDTLEYVRMLRDRKIAVYFEEENVNTLDMQGEILLTILGAIAQQESTNMSNHVKLGIKMRAQQGRIVGSTFCYGYDYDKDLKNWKINPEKSKIVKRIFKLYLDGNGTSKIANKLTEEGIPTALGGHIWNEAVITKILKNEKYKGDLLNCKYYVPDPTSRKSKRNYGEREQYYIKNHHEAIIDEETWNKAQEESKKRFVFWSKKNREDFNVYYPFSGKVECGYCKCTLLRNNSESIRTPVYFCSSTKRINIQCTNSKTISEAILKKSFMEMAIKLRREVKLDSKFSNLVKTRISYARKILLNKSELKTNKFEEGLQSELLKYAIVGGYSESGKPIPYIIRFIIKTEEDTLYRYLRRKSKNLYKLFDFYYKEIFTYFEPDKSGKMKQHFVEKIKITCEVDLGDI